MLQLGVQTIFSLYCFVRSIVLYPHSRGGFQGGTRGAAAPSEICGPQKFKIRPHLPKFACIYVFII